MKTLLSGFVVAAVVAGALCVSTHASAKEADLDCKLRFSLTGWSLIYKHAEGHGVVTCANGQSMHVKIESKGGGLTAGKSHIDNGTGRFTDVHRMEDVLGTYAKADASAGALKAGTAQVLSKGTVSLALAGAGEGVELGVSIGNFVISKAGKAEHKKAK